MSHFWNVLGGSPSTKTFGPCVSYNEPMNFLDYLWTDEPSVVCPVDGLLSLILHGHEQTKLIGIRVEPFSGILDEMRRKAQLPSRRLTFSQVIAYLESRELPTCQNALAANAYGRALALAKAHQVVIPGSICGIPS